MSLKYLPLTFFIKTGFNPPYFLTAPLDLWRYGAYYRKSPKCPEFDSRERYYDYVTDKIVANERICYLEFGVFKGASIAHWSRNNTHPDSLFWGFDSFIGLPEDWQHFHKHYSKAFFDVQGSVPAIADKRVNFVKGFFQDTLDGFLKENQQKIESYDRLVIHCDADIYSATLYVLTRLNGLIKPGTLILFDEFYSVQDEFKAVMDYQKAYNREFQPVASVRPYFQRLAVEITR